MILFLPQIINKGYHLHLLVCCSVSKVQGWVFAPICLPVLLIYTSRNTNTSIWMHSFHSLLTVQCCDSHSRSTEMTILIFMYHRNSSVYTQMITLELWGENVLNILLEWGMIHSYIFCCQWTETIYRYPMKNLKCIYFDTTCMVIFSKVLMVCNFFFSVSLLNFLLLRKEFRVRN